MIHEAGTAVAKTQDGQAGMLCGSTVSSGSDSHRVLQLEIPDANGPICAGGG